MAVDFSYPYTITADTPAVASQVQSNFADVLTWIKAYYKQATDTTAEITAAVPAVTAWTGVTYQNSWVDYGSGYQGVQYRKVGDIVYVRGSTKNGTLGSTFPVFTLPVGFRPPAILSFANWGLTYKINIITVMTNGEVSLGDGGGNVASFQNLEFSFSVTA